MNVIGAAFLARQSSTIAEVGEAKWKAFLDKFSEREPYFKSTKILSITKVPIEPFLAMNDALVAEFYNGDTQVYWRFGIKSGEWSLTSGPNKNVFKPGEYARFLTYIPAIFASYYDFGKVTLAPAEKYVDIQIADVPFKHVYFEYSIMGYAVGGFRLLGASDVRYEALKGFSRRDDVVLYRYWLPR